MRRESSAESILVKAKVVELRQFAGLSVEKSAVVLGVSVDIVMRDWPSARAWLGRELSRQVPLPEEGILRFCLFQDRNIGISVLPESKEVIIG